MAELEKNLPAVAVASTKRPAAGSARSGPFGERRVNMNMKPPFFAHREKQFFFDPHGQRQAILR